MMDCKVNDLLFLETRFGIISEADAPASYWMPSIFICFCIAASAWGQVTKEQVGVFFPHIFNQSVSVYICICIEQRDSECQR